MHIYIYIYICTHNMICIHMYRRFGNTYLPCITETINMRNEGEPGEVARRTESHVLLSEPNRAEHNIISQSQHCDLLSCAYYDVFIVKTKYYINNQNNPKDGKQQ